MSLNLPLKQILGAVIILIGLGFVSSAQAHSGHQHGQPTTVSSEAAAPAVQNPTSHEQTVAATTNESRKNDGICVGGCCGNAQCAACGLVLGSAVPEVLPLEASVRTLFPDVTIKSGIGPQDLSRPPRSFI